MTETELATAIVKILDSKKARRIRLLSVADQTSLTDYFVICEGTSRTHIRALADEVEYQLGLLGISPLHIDGNQEAAWKVLDYAHVMVHILDRDQREYYNLEKLWHGATEIDLSEILAAQEPKSPQTDTPNL